MRPSAPTRAVLFDLDGTIADPGAGITRCIQHALRTLGEPIPDAGALGDCIGPPLKESFGRLLADPSDSRVRAAIDAYRELYTVSGMYEAVTYPGIAQCLASLAGEEVTMYVATSKPHVYARLIVERLGLARYFRAVYGPELSGLRDEKADLIAHLMSEEGIDPCSAVMVGDRSHDMAGAAANGVTGIGVTWGYGTGAELLAAGASHLVDTPAELAACCTLG